MKMTNENLLDNTIISGMVINKKYNDIHYKSNITTDESLDILNIDNQFYNRWIGLSRQVCMDKCKLLAVESIQFAHWIAIPNHNMILSFEHNNCVVVAKIAN